ncbi:TPA: DUF2946 domain-containing protein [Citrobacter koseri]|nr:MULTISPECIES: DUF2946 domain-containing protein [Citrobacter]MBJ8940258.1 DUF2946 domain-containing protein [Citrobacter koseri]MBJ9121553.1 DUF2946 domain-containing protein [Citrobacter koseri]MDM2959153.1 DUF2946 domain-containing protein [Citrobacter sp. CK202]MDM3064882.1 DUF2946 domain-containing protein [Citrobacter sp. CK180]MDT7495473.1 DUF2946 domain-containing protein [Citrobacter koseri]
MHGRTRINRITAWLALFAVAMLFIAPVISKSIARQADCEHSSHSMVMMSSGSHHDMAASVPCEPSLSVAHQMMSGKAMSPVEEIVCGYCQLLVHLPFVQFALVFLLWLLLLFVICCSVRPLHLSVIFRPWAPQRARAPPAVFPFSF